MTERLRAWGVVLLLCGLVLVASLFVVAPNVLLSPSRDQTALALQRAYGFMRAGPAMTLLMALVAAVVTARAWRGESAPLRRGAMAALTLAIVAMAVLVRTPAAEMMFAPLGTVRSVALTEASHVAATDMVLGVRVGDEARAYPVSIVAYHHIVHDRLADEPFVVTY